MADATAMEAYEVSEACIACDACCDDFPDIFVMNDDHTRAQVINESPVGTFNPWDIVNVCPVDAISLIKGEMPPPPENMDADEDEGPIELEDDRPWEIRWAEAKDLEENEWERMKRYGLAYSLEEDLNKYYLRFEMPATVPNHKLKFKWGLPNKMPEYKSEITLDGRFVKIRAQLEDKRVRKLCGAVNSFPDGFLRELELDIPCSNFSKKYDPEDRILTITLDKATAADDVAA